MKIQIKHDDLERQLKDRLQSWVGFGTQIGVDDLLKLSEFATASVPRVAALANLKLQNAPGVDVAIQQFEQTALTFAATLAIANATAVKEKLLGDVREVIGWLVLIGKSVVVAAV